MKKLTDNFLFGFFTALLLVCAVAFIDEPEAATTYGLIVSFEHSGKYTNGTDIVSPIAYRVYGDGAVIAESSDKSINIDNIVSIPTEIRVTAVVDGVESAFSDSYFVDTKIPAAPGGVNGRVRVTIAW